MIAEDDDDETGPLTRSPDPPAFTRRTARVPRPLKPLWRYLVVPADIPQQFNEDLATLVARLETQDPNVAAAILAEAKDIFAEPYGRIESAERRAATLQGSVAVIASLSVAGSTLLLDPTRVHGAGWRIGLGVVLAAVLLCLAACAVRAVGATSRVFHFEQPGPERIFQRASMSHPNELTHRAAELLRASGVADEVAAVKVGLLRAAAWWFRRALLGLVVMSFLVGGYMISQEQPRKPRPPSRAVTSTAGRVGGRGIPQRHGVAGTKAAHRSTR